MLCLMSYYVFIVLYVCVCVCVMCVFLCVCFFNDELWCLMQQDVAKASDVSNKIDEE